MNMMAIKKSEISFKNSFVIDFAHDKKLYRIINIFSLMLAVLFYLLFYFLSVGIVKGSGESIFYFFTSYNKLPFGYDLLLFPAIIGALILHELVHGFFFLVFTGTIPVFGFTKMMAYAGAPDWYIKKNYYLIITLSPLAVITSAGLLFLTFIPSEFSSLVFLPMVINAAGCIGDIWCAVILINKPKETYITDSGITSTISFNMNKHNLKA